MRADPELSSPNIANPISTLIGARLNFPGAKFSIDKVLFEYRGLIGRGTMVYEVTQLFDGGRVEKIRALKIGWPLKVRPLEASTIIKLRAAISGWRAHLPKVHFSIVFTAETLGLPRVKLIRGLLHCDKLEDRQLHILAMNQYKALWEASSVAKFKEIFLDCLECE
jgi:hypothetical protein